MADQDRASSGPRPIEAWMEERTGKHATEVTIADIQALPRRRRLRYASVTSPLGGRLDRHLKHLEETEIVRLLERGDRFLAETPDEPEHASGESQE